MEKVWSSLKGEKIEVETEKKGGYVKLVFPSSKEDEVEQILEAVRKFLNDRSEEWLVGVLPIEQVPKLNDTFAEAWWYRQGATLSEQGRHEEAIVSYDKAIEINLNYDEAWNNRGVALSNHGKHGEAFASFDKAIEINPNDAEAWNNRGIALGNQGKYEDAIESLSRAFSLRQQLPDKGAGLFLVLIKLILWQGVESIASKNMKQAEEKALKFIQMKKETEEDMVQAVEEAVANFKAELSKNKLKFFTEFEVILEILSIEDPLERLKALRRKKQ